MFIIPAIDIINGKAVRLTGGDYNRMIIYHDDPLEVAKKMEGAGIKRLHLVDLDGAHEKKPVNYKVLENIASGTDLIIDFGGGIQSDESIRLAFESGAHQVTGGSVAVKNPELFLRWLEEHGNEKIILGADVKDGKIAVSGWQEKSHADIYDFLQEFVRHNVKYVISTDVSKDGYLKGPAMGLYENITGRFPGLDVIASGGVSCMDDIRALSRLPLYGVIVGKAIYEGRISLEELESFN
jgi:phosphoribosylformimino-5-aminoimidazole carboxamide ribotide isomerase